ncbi:MAG TPA: hypothetical protein VFE50_21375 [Cyclobacteriaceae bacterium]|nr:hypothetical protein [Cyclobacteriaceae bacterium]
METHAHQNRPNVDLRWFWDFEVSKIDWRKSYKTIISRIIERGSPSEWKELTKFYGEDKVVNAIKNEITFIPEYILQDVCNYFHLKKEDLLCYTRKQSRPGHWI